MNVSQPSNASGSPAGLPIGPSGSLDRTAILTLAGKQAGLHSNRAAGQAQLEAPQEFAPAADRRRQALLCLPSPAVGVPMMLVAVISFSVLLVWCRSVRYSQTTLPLRAPKPGEQAAETTRSAVWRALEQLPSGLLHACSSSCAEPPAEPHEVEVPVLVLDPDQRSYSVAYPQMAITNRTPDEPSADEHLRCDSLLCDAALFVDCGLLTAARLEGAPNATILRGITLSPLSVCCSVVVTPHAAHGVPLWTTQCMDRGDWPDTQCGVHSEAAEPHNGPAAAHPPPPLDVQCPKPNPASECGLQPAAGTLSLEHDKGCGDTTQ